MISSASESNPFQSRSTGETPGWARQKERLSRSKLKQAFLIDSDADLFMYLIQQQFIKVFPFTYMALPILLIKKGNDYN